MMPQGLTAKDMIASAEAFEARAERCVEMVESREFDEETCSWLRELESEHRSKAAHFRNIADTLGEISNRNI